MNITELICLGECETTEFKTSLAEWRDVVETICAFSNRNGGSIFIGVGDDCDIIGVDCGKNTIEKLANQIKQNTDPVIYPSVRIEEVERKTIIVVDVKEFEQKPVLAFGRAFMRVGKSNQKIGYDEIRRLTLLASKVYWDGRICENADLADIDEGKVKWFLNRAKSERRLELDSETPVKEALNKFNLLKEGMPTNAAILLFGKATQRFFAQSEIRCARFKGLKPLEFIDMKVFGRDIIAQRDDALEFVKEHIRLHAQISGTERVERWEYPIEAIREAITNAICHRDYEIASNTQIRIFDDRVEVWGCGQLPEPLIPGDLRGEHKSILRNPLVAECLFLIKFIEQWGTGTNRMIERCLDHGMPEPLFDEVAGDFVVTFRKYCFTDEVLNELNERQQNAIEYLLEHKKITNREYREINPDISERTALNDLNELVHKNMVAAKGEKKHRYYILR
ncbi:MAG: helix-turn-helix domain-containing protein [ANME-2 cluster archaeon]|jgi:ATP-dependent DNA helicase RecG|nr:helix-turn-helix domain-containing protein [ANME-2 cluster archaeon]